MKRISQITELENVRFTTEEHSVLFEQKKVLAVVKVKYEDREFTAYKIKLNDETDSNFVYLYVRNTASSTFYDITDSLKGKIIQVLKEELSAPLVAERVADKLIISTRLIDNVNQIDNAKYVELEDEESVYMGLLEEDTVYFPDKFFTPLSLKKAVLNDVRKFITFKFSLDDYKISKTHDVDLENKEFEVDGETFNASEEYIYAKYKRADDAIVVKFAPDKIYEIKIVNTDYNSLILYKKTTILPSDTCVYERYIPNKKQVE